MIIPKKLGRVATFTAVSLGAMFASVKPASAQKQPGEIDRTKIVVTAQKREQSLQDVSISVFSSVMRAVGGLAAILVAVTPAWSQSEPAPSPRPPNIVIILVDDLGYGDVGAYGASVIKTPNIDRLAREGVKLTDFYAAANICTPSRAGLLTGRYPIRTGLGHQVIQAWDTKGLPPSEITIAEALKARGYVSGAVGKWHLGHDKPYWPPTVQGFDSFYGLPYSHNQRPLSMFALPGPGVEYVKDDHIDLAQLTTEFTDKSVEFIEKNAAHPFFLYIAHTAPHLPLIPNPKFEGRSKAHAYGDVVEELDASVGRVMDTLKRLKLDKDTVVIFTSDNGPWFEGSAGNLHERKGGAGFDGGYRVPFIVRYPRQIRPGTTSSAIAMGIDVMPTLLAYAGAAPPKDVEIDGKDIRSVLAGSNTSPHNYLLLFDNENIAGIRTQRWKLVYRTYYRGISFPLAEVNYTPLFDMETDPGEIYSAEQSEPKLVAGLRATIVKEQKRFDPFRLNPAPPGLSPELKKRGEQFAPEAPRHQH